jgi:hypothetical protein
MNSRLTPLLLLLLVASGSSTTLDAEEYSLDWIEKLELEDHILQANDRENCGELGGLWQEFEYYPDICVSKIQDSGLKCLDEWH